MCGRFASFRSTQDVADDLAVAELAEEVEEIAPSWNVAPTDPVRIVVERPARTDAGPGKGEITRSLQVARWGLVPSWSKDPSGGARMINARVETLTDKPAFAKPLAVRRCLVPADGYYEWRALALPSGATPNAKAPKQPYWIHRDGEPVLFAGLYEFWRDRTKASPTAPRVSSPRSGDSGGGGGDDPARWLVSTTIITTTASASMAHIHDRMPVALPATAWDAWLDPAVGAEQAASLLAAPIEEFALRPVTSLVSSVQNDGPSLIEPDPDPADAGLPATLTKPGARR